MRNLTARLFPNYVTVAPLVVGQDTGRTKAFGNPIQFRCSIQLGDAGRQGDRQGATRSEIDGIVLFRSDPVVKVGDRLVWPIGGKDRTFVVQGPATPEAGQTAMYSVPVKELV